MIVIVFVIITKHEGYESKQDVLFSHTGVACISIDVSIAQNQTNALWIWSFTSLH